MKKFKFDVGQLVQIDPNVKFYELNTGKLREETELIGRVLERIDDEGYYLYGLEILLSGRKVLISEEKISVIEP